MARIKRTPKRYAGSRYLNRSGYTRYPSTTLKKLSRKVARLSAHRETKYHDVNFAKQPGTTALISQLTAIAQGDTILERNGQTVYGKYCLLRWWLDPAASATKHELARVMIVQSLKHSTTIPVAADILEGSATPFDFLEVTDANRGGFKVLYDKMISVGDLSTGCASSEPQGQIYIDLTKCIPIYYDGTAATDQARGNIYMLTVCLQDNTNKATINGATRVAYTDS